MCSCSQDSRCGPIPKLGPHAHNPKNLYYLKYPFLKLSPKELHKLSINPNSFKLHIFSTF